MFLDPEPAVSSQIAELVRSYPIRSKNVIAHIRKATHGAVCLENTHPFMRELWGRYWIFAHNGSLQDFTPTLDGMYRPVGSTDSELAFCSLLELLRRRFSSQPLQLDELCEVITTWARQVASFGIFNFMLSNGDFLFTYCSDRLCYVERKAPFTTAHLVDEDIAIDFSKVTTRDDRVAVIATLPLTDNESWTSLFPGECAVFSQGERLALD